MEVDIEWEELAITTLDSDVGGGKFTEETDGDIASTDVVGIGALGEGK